MNGIVVIVSYFKCSVYAIQAPGNYTVEIKPTGEPVPSEKLKLGADEVWGVIIYPSGYVAVQIY